MIGKYKSKKIKHKEFKENKMRNIIAACFGILFVCAGCGSQSYWYNEENTYSRAKVDCRECLYEAQNEMLRAAAIDRKEYGSTANVHEAYKYTLFEKCMKNRGYERTWDYKLDYFIRKGYVTNGDDMYPVAGK